MRFFLAAGLLGLLGLLQPSLATSAVASDRAQDSQLYRTSLIDAISNSHTFAEQDHATAASQQAEAGEEESYEGALTTGDASFLETGNLVGGCEICGYVVEQKEAMQPFLCRGIRDPAQQQTCVKVLLSLLWWMPNEVYWINYGCQRMDGEKWTWVRPCPAHAICSWIKSLDSGNETPYCPADANYRKPQ